MRGVRRTAKQSVFVVVLMLSAFNVLPQKAPLLVFPPPLHIAASGAPMLLAHNFTITTPYIFTRPHTLAMPHRPQEQHPVSATLTSAVQRYSALVAPVAAAAAAAAGGSAGSGATRLVGLRLEVSGTSEVLNIDTDYSYTLTVSPSKLQHEGGVVAVATASSVYGAMYAMETFVQLLDEDAGALVHSSIDIRDKPDHNWRGLMIDAGRRFFPMPLVKNLMQTMAANKLNVLHLHASDFCRWSIESKLYPELTAVLTGSKAGHYTQEDIKEMIAFGQERGIRVVPEFEMPVRPCEHVAGLVLSGLARSVELWRLAGSRSRYAAAGEARAHVLHAVGRPIAAVGRPGGEILPNSAPALQGDVGAFHGRRVQHRWRRDASGGPLHRELQHADRAPHDQGRQLRFQENS
jgi:hypothetical protein